MEIVKSRRWHKVHCCARGHPARTYRSFAHKPWAYAVGKKEKELSGSVHVFFFLSVQYSTKVCSQTRFQGVLMYYCCVSFCLTQHLCDERVSTKKKVIGITAEELGLYTPACDFFFLSFSYMTDNLGLIP